MATDFRAAFGGNGHSKGLIDVTLIAEDCALFIPNPQQPPPEDEMPIAIAEVLQKWMAATPVRVRETLPVTKGGNTVGLFVWFDRKA